MDTPPPNADTSAGVMSVVTPRVKQGKLDAFEAAVRAAERDLASMPGFKGLRLVPPSRADEPHVVVFHFDDAKGLSAWESSAERRRHLSAIDELTEAPNRERSLTGLEFWFQKPGSTQPPPPRHKMVLVTIAVIYPTSTVVGLALGPLFAGLPGWLAGLLTTIVLVLLLTYLLMPAAVRLLAGWLRS